MPLFDQSGQTVQPGARPARHPKLPQMVSEHNFNPNASPSSFVVPQDRQQKLNELYQNLPGRAPNGSGPTGLASNDSEGWRNMLMEQQEYAKLADFNSSKPQGVDVIAGGLNERHLGGSLAPATGQNMGPLPGYGGQNPVMGGLQSAYRPKKQQISSNIQNS